MVLPSRFRGLMAPVFTPFAANGQLNLNEIPKYGTYLAENSVKGILVNGTVGEGALMSIDERKGVTEKWMNVAKEFGIFVMVHVGAANMNGVIELAKHAESVGAGSILCLPDPFFRPASIPDLVDYLKVVGAAAPKTPLFYYNYPDLTGIKFDMVEFLKVGFKEIPTLSGLKYTHNNLDEGIRCVQLYDKKFTIFLGCDQLVFAALCTGFDSMIAATLNFAHKEIFEIQKKTQEGDNEGARRLQNKITDLIYFLVPEVPFLSGIKAVISKISGLQLGEPRLPIRKLTKIKLEQLEKELKDKKWI